MRKTLTILTDFKPILDRFEKDEDGAALVEYTVLLGILLVAVIAIIAFVGTWISGQWSALSAQL